MKRAVPWLAVLLVLCVGRPSAGKERTEQQPFIVVLDAGHGGSNTGAKGVIEGVYEKRFTLVLTREVARRLSEVPGVVVKMTRTDDRYISLRDRGRYANAQNADVFVSIHANASPSHTQRGFETYLITPKMLDVDAPATRRGDGPVRNGLAPQLGDLLDDIERGVSQLWSLRLAERIQKNLVKARGQKDSRGVRQSARMDVLMGPVMPAVLVEVGFIDHAVEGVELLQSEPRKQLANALVTAIVEYRALRQ